VSLYVSVTLVKTCALNKSLIKAGRPGEAFGYIPPQPDVLLLEYCSYPVGLKNLFVLGYSKRTIPGLKCRCYSLSRATRTLQPNLKEGLVCVPLPTLALGIWITTRCHRKLDVPRYLRGTAVAEEALLTPVSPSPERKRR
jgi:hypothetical protein